jgi:hypothetical protein
VNLLGSSLRVGSSFKKGRRCEEQCNEAISRVGRAKLRDRQGLRASR